MSLQVLEEFVVMLGAKVDTEKVKSFSDALAKVASVGAIVVGALKSVSLAAWGFADGYIRRADELSKANSGLFKITKEQVEMSKKYEEGMGKLGKMIESVKIRVAFGFLPTMLEMVKTFNDFLDANKDLIANGIVKLLEVVSKLSQVINNTVRFIVKIIEATIGWKGALIVLIGVFVWLKRAMLLAFVTNPIFWVIAAIGILLLLIDDFMTYLDGGESQFGEFWGSMIGWVKDNEDALRSLWEMLKTGITYLVEFGTYVTKYFGGAFLDSLQVIMNVLQLVYGLFTGNTELMSEAWSNMIDNLISMFKNYAMLFEPIARLITTAMTKAWDAIVSYVTNKITQLISAIKGFVSSIGDALSNVFDIVTAPFARAFDWIANKFGSLGGLISGAVSGARNLVGMGGAATVSNTVNSGGNMTVNAPISVTSNDPIRAASATQSGLETTLLNTAQRNMYSRSKL